MAGDLLSDHLEAIHLGGHPDFEETLTKRHAAKKALLDADADRKLRRALSLKHKGINTEFHLGQQVFFWRDARQPDLVKVRWLGPALIVMKEYKNPQEAHNQVSVHWLAFKSQLIRYMHHITSDRTSRQWHILSRTLKLPSTRCDS